ncbi:MAG TPA: ABC transporter permease [Bryobacteraceae bacterium]|jgi:putative ABC transport system permease protein|nr:ABC transporter permease [Bryobacteraceae bacterium]
MSTLLQDLVFGTRMLAKKPAFTLTALFTVMLGIGATTSIYSVVDAVLLRPLPYAHPDRLVEIWNTNTRQKVSYPGMAFDTLDQWRSAADFLEGFEGYQPTSMTLSTAGEPRMLQGVYVSGGLMPFLGVRPQLGRLLIPDDGRPDRDHAIVLSDSLWRGVYRADPAILGKPVILNKEEFVVAGVMTPGFRFPQRSGDFWIPFSLTHDSVVSKKLRPWIVTRLRAGIPLELAQKRMDAIAQRLPPDPSRPAGWSASLITLDSKRASPNTRRNLMVLLGAVGLVLAISCVNTGSMLLTRAVAREKEMAVRAALGAGRRRLIRQLLTESVLLSVLGGALGIGLAAWGVAALVRSIPREIDFFSTNPISLDRGVLAFSLAVSAVTGLLFGLLPALRGSRANLHGSLSLGGRGAFTVAGTRGLRYLLVTAQVALSFSLLIGAGLMIKSFWKLYNVPNGFDGDHLLAVSLQLPRARYHTPADQALFFEDLGARLAAVPGVESATFAGGPPLGNGGITFGNLETDAHTETAADKNLVLPFTEVAENYFATLRIPLLQGRSFSAVEQQKAAGATIINRTMAQRYWPNQSAVGRKFRLGDSPKDWRTVVGVVGDVREFDMNSRPEAIQLYFPLGTLGANASRWLLVRTAGDPLIFLPAIRSAIRSLDRDQPILQAQGVADLLQQSVAGPRFYVWIMGVFSALALLLSAMGVYGVINYSATSRVQEVGIRMALGAKVTDILRTIVGQGALSVAMGIALGIAGALSLSRFLSGFLFEVRPADAPTIWIAAAVYFAVAVAAAATPAWRSLRIDPLEALRHD